MEHQEYQAFPDYLVNQDRLVGEVKECRVTSGFHCLLLCAADCLILGTRLTLFCCNISFSYFPSPSGDPGVTGPRGAIGEAGFKGERGDPGLQGPAGNMSDVDMEHMKGEKGDSGISGIKHHAGMSHMGNILYLLSSNIIAGVPGFTGPKGTRGMPGDPGQRGADGEPGLPGQSG